MQLFLLKESQFISAIIHLNLNWTETHLDPIFLIRVEGLITVPGVVEALAHISLATLFFLAISALNCLLVVTSDQGARSELSSLLVASARVAVHRHVSRSTLDSLGLLNCHSQHHGGQEENYELHSGLDSCFKLIRMSHRRSFIYSTVCLSKWFFQTSSKSCTVYKDLPVFDCDRIRSDSGID